MPQHPHAHVLRAIADGKQVQVKYSNGWTDCTGDSALQMIGHAGAHIRIKPRTININGFEVPEPLATAPKDGETFYTVSLMSSKGFLDDDWNGCGDHQQCLDRGVIHSTPEAATLHAQAMLSFTQPKKAGV